MNLAATAGRASISRSAPRTGCPPSDTMLVACLAIAGACALVGEPRGSSVATRIAAGASPPNWAEADLPTAVAAAASCLGAKEGRRLGANRYLSMLAETAETAPKSPRRALAQLAGAGTAEAERILTLRSTSMPGSCGRVSRRTPH